MFASGPEDETVGYLTEWIPSQDYREKAGFQTELREYLDKQLNHRVVGMGIGNVGDDVPVRVDHGPVEADVAVGDDVGVVLVHEFTSVDGETVDEQVESYRAEFSTIVVVACGVREMAQWEEITDEYSSEQFSVTGGEDIHFMHKKRMHFGKDPADLRDDDGFFDWFF
ncbi:hypothetical protein BRC64_05755 [Halobacteriales archaeon QH_10_67_22]|nr:MAG: hypothetical protein BRC64_05755 [Halobacteriales archaeon QH_10_67_22]